jgi:hypothetical protein
MMPGCGTPKGVTTTPAALFGGQQAAEHQPEKTIRVFPNPAQLCETDSGFGGSRRTTSLACWAGCKQYKSALARCLYEWKSIFLPRENIRKSEGQVWRRTCDRRNPDRIMSRGHSDRIVVASGSERGAVGEWKRTSRTCSWSSRLDWLPPGLPRRYP